MSRYVYDAAGRVVVNTQGDFSPYYGYDEVGNRMSMAFLGGGVAYFTYYEYDPRNLLAALTDPLGQTVCYERDQLGREVAKLLPNGVTTYHAYDLAGQVTSIVHTGPTGVLQSLEYTYDDDGQRTKIVREDGTRIYFSYDLAHRLTGEDWLDPSDVHLYAFAYDYDAAGNRLKKTFNGEVTYYDYNNLNQLTTEAVLGGDATYYTWTADGAMATKHDATGWTYYTWDVDESLTQIAAPEVTLDNRYNARMQRVQREEDNEASNLIYDAQKLIAEVTTEGDLIRYYLSEGGSVYSPLVSQLGSQHWELFDALGTVLGLTAGDGSQSDSFLYEAFGTSLGRTGTTTTPYQYVGGYGYFDEPGVGLEQVWWRWLDPATGGWLSRDVVDRWWQATHAMNSPTTTIDPTGRVPVWIGDIIGWVKVHLEILVTTACASALLLLLGDEIFRYLAELVEKAYEKGHRRRCSVNQPAWDLARAGDVEGCKKKCDELHRYGSLPWQICDEGCDNNGEFPHKIEWQPKREGI